MSDIYIKWSKCSGVDIGIIGPQVTEHLTVKASTMTIVQLECTIHHRSRSWGDGREAQDAVLHSQNSEPSPGKGGGGNLAVG